MAEILIVYLIPLVIILLFIVNLIKFIKCPKEDAYKRKKIGFLIATIVFGIVLIAIIGFFIMLMSAIRYM